MVHAAAKELFPLPAPRQASSGQPKVSICRDSRPPGFLSGSSHVQSLGAEEEAHRLILYCERTVQNMC